MSAAAEARSADLAALTGVRGIAAWAVVLYHVRLSLLTIMPAPVIAVLAKGYLAVDLFFVLSGFVIWLNYAQPIANRKAGAVGLFLWRRIARVWPLHVVLLAAFVGFAMLLRLTGRGTADYPFAELPLHVLMIQNWGFTDALTWNDPAWSISTEFAAYLAFPALVLVAARVPRLPSGALLGLAGALSGAIWAVFAANGQTSLGADIPHLGLWRCLAGFMLGCVACALWQRGTGSAWVWAGGAFGWLLGGVLLGWPETAIVPSLAFTLLLALALSDNRLSCWLGRGAVLWLGEISYSTYLAHVLLFTLFKLVFVSADLQIGWAGLAAYLALVLAISALLHRWVERPAQAALNRLARARGGGIPQPQS